MQRIEIKLLKFKALAHSGKQLYQPYARHSHLYEDGGYSQRECIRDREFDNWLDKMRANSSALFNGEYDLFGTIEESRHIYDTKMPHFAYEVDRLQQGNQETLVNIMVRDVDFEKDGTPIVSCTLLNSRLQGSKQTGPTHQSEFFLLGALDTKPVKPLGNV